MYLVFMPKPDLAEAGDNPPIVTQQLSATQDLSAQLAAVPMTSSPTPETYYASLLVDEHKVPNGTHIEIGYAWGAKTVELVQEYLDTNKMQLLIDGVEQSNPNANWSTIAEGEDYDGDGQNDYKARWVFPLPNLVGGNHWVRLIITLTSPISDGFDQDGDGQPDTYSGTDTLETVIFVE